ncbi:cytoplasmic tRNA 2-thiolation protein [Anaeramoeba flamelloides]|uniref:Cytoplasmic tRNA 2-thiolation protein n=1 Tax=Anaeramoeba flamelloides TaxID=1746091 RepID=A0ABQ8YKV3_9EUKA|nr:cytoplasmic tRNA 2-thiolation protein [Anaeramoeba flamelloides]
MTFSVDLLHVNTHSVLQEITKSNLNDEEEYFDNLLSISKQFGLQFKSVGLELHKKDKPLLNLLKSCSRSPSIQDELIKIATRRRILQFAHQENFDVILFSDTAEQLGFRTICLLGQGRGSSLPWHVNKYLNKKETGLSICYPAKNSRDEELRNYCQVNKLKSLSTQFSVVKTTKKKHYKSITQNFFNQLIDTNHYTPFAIMKITNSLQWSELELKLLKRITTKNENNESEVIEKEINQTNNENEIKIGKKDEKVKEEEEKEEDNEKEKEKEEEEEEEEKEKEEKEKEEEKEEKEEKEKEIINSKKFCPCFGKEICQICLDAIPEESQENCFKMTSEILEMEITCCDFCRSRIIPFVDLQLLKQYFF